VKFSTMVFAADTFGFISTEFVVPCGELFRKPD
jgi:hypothetical protein